MPPPTAEFCNFDHQKKKKEESSQRISSNVTGSRLGKCRLAVCPLCVILNRSSICFFSRSSIEIGGFWLAVAQILFSRDILSKA
jgi:hypothetical protein